MKRILATAGVLAAGLTVGLAAPASAADNTTKFHSKSGTLLARVTWDDSHDNLCVRSLVAGHKVTATLTLLDGGWGPVRVSDSGLDTKPNCTGNLSIPEDRRTFLIVGDSTHSIDDSFFS